jgi:tRNA (guanine26-N2/guanine27-N2)-dimethyltransferase
MLDIPEGAARILTPQKGPERGPASSDVQVFYNPAMGPCRDVCTLVVHALGKSIKRPLRVLDGLSGTGVRAIRLALESGCDFESIVANDRSTESFELIQDNIQRNNAGRAVSALRSDLKVTLAGERFDYIDIDPFGPPVEFIPAAIGAIHHKGLLGITATDTGPLCGTNPMTCWRRYGAMSVRSEYMHETAARILIAHCIRQGAALDVALRPVLVQSDDHYVRLYLSAERSAARANAVLRELGYYTTGRETLPMNEGAPEKGSVMGPLWLGELFDRGLMDIITAEFARRSEKGPGFHKAKKVAKLLELMAEEAGMPAFFFELDAVARKTRSGPPRLMRTIEALREAGFRASRTHFSPMGFRTDASPSRLEELFRELTRHK